MIARLVALLAVAMIMLRGAHMVRSPRSYVGDRWYEARDPRTVRRFGLYHCVIGGFVVALILIKLVSE